MNPLIKKEIRLLLPAWITALLLAILPAWINGLAWVSNFSLGIHDWTTWDILFVLGVVFLGIASFGQEISSGAFTILLSQPAERRRLWQVKTTILSIAFGSVWLAAVSSVVCQFYLYGYLNLQGLPHNGNGPAFNADVFEFLTVSALITFSGGLWTTLLLRQITAAFWVTLLAPMAICMAASLLVDFTPVPDRFVNVILLIVLFFYSIAGFFYARKLFFNAQDVQWTGGEISFQWRKNDQTRALSAPGEPRHWLATLVGKEIQLHQANLVIAVVLFVLDLACFFVHKIHPHFQNPDVTYILEIVWIIWLVMPLLIGCTTIAEERKLGVFDSQKCLPVSRSTQLGVKFSIALILSLLLGGLIPFLFFERTSDTSAIAHILFIVAAAIFFISFYASSLARSTLQAIGFTVLVTAAIAVYEFATATGASALENFPFGWLAGLEWLKLYLGSAVLIGVLGCLVFWNFKWLHENRKLWRRNLAAILAAFVSIFVLTNGIYFRTWEFFTPPEPSHGPERISDSANIKFAWSGSSLYVLLPDGRLWNQDFIIRDLSRRWFGFELYSEFFGSDRNPSQFINGSNWVAIAGNYFQEVGIQSDGSLWSLQKKSDHWNNTRLRDRPLSTGPITITRLGAETDWDQVAPYGDSFWLLKKDGTLWAWGTNAGWNGQGYNIPKKFKLDLAMPPGRLSEETNWIRLFPAHVEKKDGSIWSWNDYGKKKGLEKIPGLNGNQWSNFNFSPNGVGFFGVKTNGQLSDNGELSGDREDHIELDQNAKWKQVADAGWISIVAIRDDGTLWSCGVPGWNFGKPAQLGNHSDWIALTHNRFSGVALAADGSLWAWKEPSDHFLLAPSRKPVYLGNIFQGTGSNQHENAP